MSWVSRYLFSEKYTDVRDSGVGLAGGIVAGAAIGSLLGPVGGIFGGITGGAVGQVLEQRSIIDHSQATTSGKKTDRSTSNPETPLRRKVESASSLLATSIDWDPFYEKPDTWQSTLLSYKYGSPPKLEKIAEKRGFRDTKPIILITHIDESKEGEIELRMRLGNYSYSDDLCNSPSVEWIESSDFSGDLDDILSSTIRSVGLKSGSEESNQ